MRSLFIIISMIKVAILEYEKETKDIVFQLSKLFMHEDWCFRHYLKASDLAKRMKEEEYQLFVFDEMFKTSRIESVFVHDNPNAIVIYVKIQLRRAAMMKEVVCSIFQKKISQMTFQLMIK